MRQSTYQFSSVTAMSVALVAGPLHEQQTPSTGLANGQMQPREPTLP
jgi:hypothetical protein